jgi:hypothetical protein
LCDIAAGEKRVLLEYESIGIVAEKRQQRKKEE